MAIGSVNFGGTNNYAFGSAAINPKGQVYSQMDLIKKSESDEFHKQDTMSTSTKAAIGIGTIALAIGLYVLFKGKGADKIIKAPKTPATPKSPIAPKTSQPSPNPQPITSAGKTKGNNFAENLATKLKQDIEASNKITDAFIFNFDGFGVLPGTTIVRGNHMRSYIERIRQFITPKTSTENLKKGFMYIKKQFSRQFSGQCDACMSTFDDDCKTFSAYFNYIKKANRPEFMKDVSLFSIKGVNTEMKSTYIASAREFAKQNPEYAKVIEKALRG